MLNTLKTQLNTTRTENGAVTYSSTDSHCLDFFASAGAMRCLDDIDVARVFMRAYAEDPDLAMKILFWARDVRGGLGERKIFRTSIKWLAHAEPQSLVKNLPYISEYGRWDDLLVLLDTPCREETLSLIREQWIRDTEPDAEVSLLAKWLPSVNTSDKNTVRQGKMIARYLGITDADYRKTLSRLRAKIKIIENNLRERDYTFDYSKQPSRAMLKYRRAFIRNDLGRYSDFLEDVAEGRAKMHTSALMPYDIIRPFFEGDDFTRVDEEVRRSADVTWSALEDFDDGKNSIAVIDGSGSMYGYSDPMPATVALSLGIYFAERSKGAFKNHFITFSETPQLVEIKGRDIFERVRYCASYNEVANTDLMKAFSLILSAAIDKKADETDMPERIYIISDMEFDECAENSGVSTFRCAKELFESYGYRLPEVVFWNVACRHGHMPVTKNEQGVALVSGCTPSLFKGVTKGNLDPVYYMTETVCTERYSRISA